LAPSLVYSAWTQPVIGFVQIAVFLSVWHHLPGGYVVINSFMERHARKTIKAILACGWLATVM